MKKGEKNDKHLKKELDDLRQRVAELEKLENEHMQIRERLKLELVEHRQAKAALQESEEKYRILSLRTFVLNVP